MDFSQFLVENPDIPLQTNNKPYQEQIKITNKLKEKKKETVKTEKEDYTTVKNFDIKSNCKLNGINVKSKSIEERPYQSQEFKRGDFVIIQRLENSHLNIYKGYVGQIKECLIIDELAYVILEAMNYPTAIKFPFGHLVHRTKFF
jgi:hypothetical protein